MYTVIVADDEQEIRRSLIRKVDWGSVGFQVIGEAENGAEALELTEKLEPDLLLGWTRKPVLQLYVQRQHLRRLLCSSSLQQRHPSYRRIS